MYSILVTVFKASIGLLVNKGTDVEAEKFQEGDVADHKFRSFVVHEIEQAESEMEEREDLRISVSHFKEGVVHFCEVLDKAQTKEKGSLKVPHMVGTTPTTLPSEISISKHEDDISPVSLEEIPLEGPRRQLRPTLNELMASTDEAFQQLSIESSPSSKTSISTKEAFQVRYEEGSPLLRQGRISEKRLSTDESPNLLELQNPISIDRSSRNSTDRTFLDRRYVEVRPLLPTSKPTGLRNLERAEGNDFKRAMKLSKGGFKNAYLKATEAFNNEDLSLSDRIKAMAIRVAATLLEKIEYPEDALAPCMLYLEELHSMKAVQASFAMEFMTGLRRGFTIRSRKDVDCRAVISSVCHMNRVIYDIMQRVGKVNLLMTWPCVNTASLMKLAKTFSDVDPLRDSRVTNVLRELRMEHYCVIPWSFGQEREDEHKLKDPRGIVTSKEGMFIIADHGDRNVKVFDRRGKFKFSLPLPPVDEVLDVAIDKNDCLYVLVGGQNSAGDKATGVCVFEKSGRKHRFPLRKGFTGYNLTVDDNSKMLVTSSSQTVEIYELNGKPIGSFGEGTLKTDASAITAANDGRVMVWSKQQSDIQVFSEKGKAVLNFHVDGSYHTHERFPKIAFHQASEHLVVAGFEKKNFRLDMLIFTKNGEFVRTIQYGEERIDYITGITVTREGRFAAAVRQVDSDGQFRSKILVV